MTEVSGMGPAQQMMRQNRSQLEKVSHWCYENPTTVKVINFMAKAAAVGLLATSPLLVGAVGMGLGVSIVLVGTLACVATAIALKGFDLLIGPHHDMKNHLFEPGQCEGGKLFYDGDVPVLSLESDDPYKAGKAHGYLCGKALNLISKRIDLVLHTLSRKPRAEELPETLAAVRKTIPAEYLRELEGIVEGYKQWSKEHPLQFPKTITVDDLILLHLMPDSMHFHPEHMEGDSVFREPLLSVACTSMIDRDPARGFVFARNMDWPSFGVMGMYSLVINRKHRNGLQNTIEVGVPGLVGTLTGMNTAGLSLSMNVCGGSTHEIEGMPAAFYNRTCLEKCTSVKEVEQFTQVQSPLGPYHLTVADQTAGQTIHFYQSPTRSHVIRRWKENEPVVTLNYCYSPKPECGMPNDVTRTEMIQHFLSNRNGQPFEAALALPEVNNTITTHAVVMEPKTGRFAVAFDNAYAAKNPLRNVSTARLLRN